MDPARRSWQHRANAGEQRLARSALPATPAFAPAWREKVQDVFQISWFAQHNSYSLAFLRWQRAPRTSYSRPFSLENSFCVHHRGRTSTIDNRKRAPLPRLGVSSEVPSTSVAILRRDVRGSLRGSRSDLK